MADPISYDHFAKLDLRVAKVRRINANGSSDAVQPISGSIQRGDAGSNSSSHLPLVRPPLCTEADGWKMWHRGAPKGKDFRSGVRCCGSLVNACRS